MALHAECLRAAPRPLPWAVSARVAHPRPSTAVSPRPRPSLCPHVGLRPFLAMQGVARKGQSPTCSTSPEHQPPHKIVLFTPHL